ncbi:MAG: glycosyltransferase [Candidatus Kapaibacteriota bacterium]
MEEILVTALVSTYNSEKFIKGCLDNLISQTLFAKNQLEIIVIDAASEQNERAIVLDFQKKFPNIKYIRTETRISLYSAWNVGIKHSKGKYLTNANTDDRSHPQALEILVNELEETPDVPLAYSNYIITTVENQTFENCTPFGYTMYPYFDRQQLLYVTYIGHRPIWRKSLHEEFGYFSEQLRIASDIDWWLRISEKYSFKHIPLPLGLYYHNPKGIEHSNSEECRNETLNVRSTYQIKANKKGLDYFYPGIVEFKFFLDFSQKPLEKPDFSVIVLAPSHSSNLTECINSILNQTYKNFEVIVITKKSNNYIQTFYKYDKRVQLFFIDTIPSYRELLQMGISRSKGKFLIFFNENNKMFPIHLQMVSNIIKICPDCSIFPSNYFIVNQSKYLYYEHSRETHKPNEFNLLKTIPQTMIQFAHLTFKKQNDLEHLIDEISTYPETYRTYSANCENYLPTIEYYNYIESTDKPAESKPFSNTLSSLHKNTSNENLRPETEINEFKFDFRDIKEGENNPIVSIIIPCYKNAQFLSEVLESVVEQTFKDWECIIVNDGSPDNTREVAQQLISKYPDKKITYLEKENGGVASARNYGIENAKGKYILPLDADDKIAPTFLEKTVKVLEENADIHIVYTDLKQFGEVERIVPSKDFDPRTLLNLDYISGNSLFRKEVWETIGGYKNNIGYEDWEFWINAIENGFKGFRIPEVLFFYRVKTESRYTSDLQKDLFNKAKIVSLHPASYSDAHQIWAKKVLEGKANTIPVKNIPNLIPLFHIPKMKKELASFKVLSIITTYNEEDIIEQVLTDLIRNGIDVYLLDDNSDDRTVEIAEKFLGKGLIKIEKINANTKQYEQNKFNWELLLKRKEEIADQLKYDWYIHSDADIFIESPWENIPLKEAIFFADSLSYNALSFKVFNFRPYNNDFQIGQDVRKILDHYEPPEIPQAFQIRAWKKGNYRAVLSFGSGNDVYFDNRRIFPIPFIMRHYPIRSQSHGRRKIFKERLPRLKQNESSKNWYNRYNLLIQKNEFIWKKEELIEWDPVKVRLELLAEYSLSSLFTTAFPNLSTQNPSNFNSIVEFLVNFNNTDAKQIEEICQYIENSMNVILNSPPLNIASLFISQFQPNVLNLFSQFLSLKLAILLSDGLMHYASKIKELILYIQNLTLLSSPFINLLGYSETTMKQSNQDIYPKKQIEELLSNSRLEEALEIISNYLDINPNDTDALNDLAVIESFLGNIENAKAILNKVLAISKDNQIARENLNKLLELESNLG